MGSRSLTIEAIAGGLLPREEQFAQGVARGLTQADAYRAAFNCPKLHHQKVAERASRLVRKPVVTARVRDLLRASRLIDLTSEGQWAAAVLTDIEGARANANYNAAMQGHRLVGSGLGMLHENLHITGESRLTDDELVARLAGGDARKVAALKYALGRDSFDVIDVPQLPSP